MRFFFFFFFFFFVKARFCIRIVYISIIIAYFVMYSKSVNKIFIYRVFDYFKYHFFHVYCKCLYINLNFLENHV